MSGPTRCPASHETHIYGMIDPRDRSLIYVGRSCDPARRIRDHMRPVVLGLGSQHPLHVRLRNMQRAGVSPELVVLETVNKTEAHRAEERWIAAFRPAGTLCNQRDVCAIPIDAPGPRKPRPPAPKTSRGPRGPINTPSDMTAEGVRAFRAKHGWSQAELARRVGVHYSTVSRWEAGNRSVPMPVARLLAKIH